VDVAMFVIEPVFIFVIVVKIVD